VEVLCSIIKGKTLKEALTIKEDVILEAIGSKAEELRKKVTALLEILDNGFNQYQENLPNAE
jgi:NifU-like protein involved in Fe-S cluster formation